MCGHMFQVSVTKSINWISGIEYFREISLESSRNVSETTPWASVTAVFTMLNRINSVRALQALT